MRERGIILTEGVVLGLFFIQRYRFLTIDQFARAAGMHRDTASRQLRSLELRRVLSHFGNACAWPRANPKGILSHAQRLGASLTRKRHPF